MHYRFFSHPRCDDVATKQAKWHHIWTNNLNNDVKKSWRSKTNVILTFLQWLNENMISNSITCFFFNSCERYFINYVVIFHSFFTKNAKNSFFLILNHISGMTSSKAPLSKVGHYFEVSIVTFFVYQMVQVIAIINLDYNCSPHSLVIVSWLSLKKVIKGSSRINHVLGWYAAVVFILDRKGEKTSLPPKERS